MYAQRMCEVLAMGDSRAKEERMHAFNLSLLVYVFKHIVVHYIACGDMC